jgi:hypothetical protein
MGWAGTLCLLLGISRLARLVFISICLWQFYRFDEMLFFYIYVSVFGLLYLLEVIVFSNRLANFILTIFGLVWFRLPLLVTKRRIRTRLVFGSVLELFDCLFGAYLSAYLTITRQTVGFGFTIPHLVLSLMSLPLFYEGTLFTPELEIRVVDYIILIVENFLTISFFAVFLTLPYFWTVFAVCSLWRLISCCDSFAFWSSLHSAVSPFRAFHASRGARTMMPAYLLFMETFLTVYCTFWYMHQTALNLVFRIIYSVYGVGFLLFEISSSLSPFTHRVKPIQSARAAQPEMFDPEIL